MSAEWERFKKDIIDRVDLAEYIGQYSKLRKAGSRFMGLCPLHGDNDPSLSVSPDVGLWHCFGCKNGGDIFNFVMQKESMSFFEAAQLLSDRYNIPLPSLKGEKADKTPKQAIMEINKAAERFFAEYIRHPSAQRFRDYLKERNIPKSVVERFNIGASPDSWEALSNQLRKQGFNNDLIVQTGLARSKTKNQVYDCFRNRLMIPIHDNLGRTVGFSGRVIDKGEPKYVNTSENPIFQKGQLLYALNLARESILKNDYVIVMEGYTDVMRAHQMGMLNAVASMGTALTSKHIEMIKRLTEKVYLSFDGDKAGIAASVRSVEELVKAETQVRVVVFDDGLDPEEFLLQRGKDAFMKKLKSAEVGIWFLIRQILPSDVPGEMDEKIAVLKQAIEIVNLVMYGEEQNSLIEKVARHLEMDEKAALLEFEKYFKGKPKVKVVLEKYERAERSNDDPDIVEKGIIMYFVFFFEFRKAAKEHLSPSDFKYHPYRKFTQMLFDLEFPIETANLADCEQVSENDEFMRIVSEMMNSFDDTHEYSIEEFSDYICKLKKSTMKDKRLKNRKLIQSAIEDKNKDLESKLMKENETLAHELKKYSQGFVISLSNIE